MIRKLTLGFALAAHLLCAVGFLPESPAKALIVVVFAIPWLVAPRVASLILVDASFVVLSSLAAWSIVGGWSLGLGFLTICLELVAYHLLRTQVALRAANEFVSWPRAFLQRELAIMAIVTTTTGLVAFLAHELELHPGNSWAIACALLGLTLLGARLISERSD